MNKATRRSLQEAPRLMSGSRGGQSDRRIVSREGSASNDPDAIQTRALTYYQRSLGPEKADSAAGARLRDQRPGRRPVWACVGAAGEVAA